MMSSQNMGRASKDRGNKNQNTPHKNTTEWPKAPDGLNPKVQATAEQIRIAQIINDANKSDDPDLQKKIDQVSELTGKSNDTAIIALHDCDNDPERAVIMLLEGTQNEGEWELSGKKKKNRQSQKQSEAVSGEGGKGSTSANNKENRTEKGERNRGDRPQERNRGERGGEGGKSGREDFRNRGPPRLNRGRGGNWRNKENEKNERNLEESRRERNADGKDDGRPRGGGRRGRGNRGGDGSRGGNREGGGGGGGGRVRTFQNRGLSSDGFPQSMDTWTNSTAEQASDNAPRSKAPAHNQPGTTGNWSEIANSEDWSEEDWTESLTETKVFTPSTSVQSSLQKNEDSPSASGLTQSLDLVSLLQKQQGTPSSDMVSAAKNSIQSNGVSPMAQTQVSQASQLGQNQFSLSPYAQQAAESIKAAVGIPSGMNSNSSHHGTTNSAYSSVFSSGNQQQAMDLSSNAAASTLQHMQQQANAVAMAKNNQALAQRPKAQRPRIPPPSKIPESAVEMPDDGISNLDVQFGALEFGTDSSLSGIDFSGLPDSVGGFQDSTNIMSKQMSVGAGGHPNSVAISSSIPITLNSSSTLGKDSSSAYGLSSSVSTVNKDLAQNSTSISGSAQKVSAPDTMMMSSQQSERKSVSGPSYGSQRSSQSTTVDGPYSGQKSLLGSSSLSSNSNNYSHQSSSLTQMDNLSNVANQSQNSYMSNAHNASANSYGMQQSTAYNAGSAQTTGYQPQQSGGGGGGYSASYTYPTQQQGYANSASHSLSNNSSKLNSSMNHVDQQQNSQLSYDNSSGGSLSSNSGASNQVGSLGGSNLGGSSALGGLVATSSSTITTSVLKNSVPATGKPQANIPPGVPAAAATPTMMSHHPYIMSQAAGMPFYGLQPTIYSVEEMQMMQSRMGYYDMQYQAPTSLTGRDPSMASVAYTDVKFSRADSEASSVATTLSQGQNATQTHGQTFMNAAPALHPGYGYYFPAQGIMPGSIPHYAPPMFQQVPPATNAHGASSNSQYQKATAYGSHTYGSGTGTTPDLSNSIYSKSHQPLAKGAGPIGNSSTPYAPTPFIPLLAHGQPHSINLHHHLQDSPQAGAGAHSGPQRTQQSMGQAKGPSSGKQSYPFWNNN